MKDYHDLNGIGRNVRNAMTIMMGASRRTGRTSAMIMGLVDGDVVVFATAAERDRVRRLADVVSPDTNVRFALCDPTRPDMLRNSMSGYTGRVKFTHEWLEAHYLHQHERAVADIERLARELIPPPAVTAVTATATHMRLMGLDLHVVEAGTEIKCPDTGQVEVVGDGGAVKSGGKMYCTQVVFDALKREFGKVAVRVGPSEMYERLARSSIDEVKKK
jgi:hypothetical protein